MKKKLHKVNKPVLLVLLLGSLLMIFPFVWVVLSSFKTVADVYAYPPKWLPSSWKFSNYATVFEMIPFARYYVNSIYTSVMQTALQLGISVTAAYALVVLDFPGKKILFSVVRSTMFVPTIVILI
ncbi:MAG: carbohydrate ABC transporter permease, partial [Sphaerochaetaceae bacterium]|nr:carbohydrate ABC transporter permease [Sphaerochaetaceae bacterium]